MTNVQTEDKPAGEQVQNPVEYDKAGIPLRTPAHGAGKLRIGGTQSPGRPKEVIRDRMRKAYDTLALPTMERILNDPKASDELKAKVAADLARICIGTDDKVQMADRDAFLRSLARATVRLKYTDSDSAKLLEVVADELGIE